jgi:hypothetical protein
MNMEDREQPSSQTFLKQYQREVDNSIRVNARGRTGNAQLVIDGADFI